MNQNLIPLLRLFSEEDAKEMEYMKVMVRVAFRVEAMVKVTIRV